MKQRPALSVLTLAPRLLPLGGHSARDRLGEGLHGDGPGGDGGPPGRRRAAARPEATTYRHVSAPGVIPE
jgi:hypothetical protein